MEQAVELGPMSEKHPAYARSAQCEQTVSGAVQRELYTD